MRSCLGLLFSLLILAAVIGTGLLIWHLSATSEFTAKPATAQP